MILLFEVLYQCKCRIIIIRGLIILHFIQFMFLVVRTDEQEVLKMADTAKYTLSYRGNAVFLSFKSKMNILYQYFS